MGKAKARSMGGNDIERALPNVRNTAVRFEGNLLCRRSLQGGVEVSGHGVRHVESILGMKPWPPSRESGFTFGHGGHIHIMMTALAQADKSFLSVDQ
jgi:hypothetical protein